MEAPGDPPTRPQSSIFSPPQAGLLLGLDPDPRSHILWSWLAPISAPDTSWNCCCSKLTSSEEDIVSLQYSTFSVLYHFSISVLYHFSILTFQYCTISVLYKTMLCCRILHIIAHSIPFAHFIRTSFRCNVALVQCYFSNPHK